VSRALYLEKKGREERTEDLGDGVEDCKETKEGRSFSSTLFHLPLLLDLGTSELTNATEDSQGA